MRGDKNTLKVSGFVFVDNVLVWQETHHHKLDENGVVYVTMSPADLLKGDETKHLIYKLSRIPFDRGEPEPSKPYFWASLWNSSTHSGHKVSARTWVSKYATVEDAVSAKIKDGWPVKMLTFDDLIRNPFGK